MNRSDVVARAAASIGRGSRSFSAASRLFDRRTRERAWLLYCWCRHCDDWCDGQDLGSPDVMGRASVGDLFDKTRAVIGGHSVGELPFDALAALLAECPLPVDYLIEHLRGFEMDTSGWRPADRNDLLLYCDRVAGVVGRMMAIIMGVPVTRATVLRKASHLGIAFQLWNIARDVADDHRGGRCYLPAEWLMAQQLPIDQLLAPASRPKLVQIVRRLDALAAWHQRSAHEALPDLPFRSRWAVAAASRIYGAIGSEVCRRGAAAWDDRIVIPRRRKIAALLPTFIQSARLGARA